MKVISLSWKTYWLDNYHVFKSNFDIIHLTDDRYTNHHVKAMNDEYNYECVSSMTF